MGWTFSQRDRKQTAKDFFSESFDHKSGRVLDVTATLKEAYIAYEVLDPETGAVRGVIGIACLTSWRPNAEFNFGYKDMDETMGPGIANCPKRIFDLLTPVEQLCADGVYHIGRSAVWARQWRRRVAKRLAEKSARPALRRGMVLTFEPPIRFSWGPPYGKLRCVDAKRRHFTTDLDRPISSVEANFRLHRSTINRALLALVA